MARLSRIDQLRERAKRFGLDCDTWAPGDGKRRFQFLTIDGHSRGFSLTIGTAERWLGAYIEGYQDGKEEGEQAAHSCLDRLINSAAYGEEL